MHESKFLKLSIILPFTLLVWGIYAFLQEGNSWGARRGFHDDVKKEYIIKAKPEPTHEVHGQDDHAH